MESQAKRGFKTSPRDNAQSGYRYLPPKEAATSAVVLSAAICPACCLSVAQQEQPVRQPEPSPHLSSERSAE